MPVGKQPHSSAWQDNGSARAPSSSKQIGIRKSSSRGSINFDISKSPDARSVALEKELGDITVEDQVSQVCPAPVSLYAATLLAA